MPSVKKPAAPGQAVQCAVCGKEIPRSAAIVPENKDYVIHYCSPDCKGKAEKGGNGGRL
jgi:hypothetical protein